MRRDRRRAAKELQEELKCYQTVYMALILLICWTTKTFVFGVVEKLEQVNQRVLEMHYRHERSKEAETAYAEWKNQIRD